MKKLQIFVSAFTGLLFTSPAIYSQATDTVPTQVISSEFDPDSVSSKKDVLSPFLPPENKKFGIGVKPFGSLICIGYALQLRGALSLFAVDRHAEIAFPVVYITGKEANFPWRVLYLDATYRRFTNGKQKGFYYSGGLRYAYFEGEKYTTFFNSNKIEYTGDLVVKNKLGVYAGIGYRHFTKKGLYWGGNIILGTYFSRKIHDIETADGVPLNFILGSDLLEIGYAF